MSTNCLKSPNPTRRAALGGLVAAAVGIVAAPRGEAATTKPAVPPRAAPPAADYDDSDGERLSPALARLKAESMTILVSAAYAVADSLSAVLQAHYGEEDGECDGGDCEWCAECDGLWYTVDAFSALYLGQMKGPIHCKLDAEREQRRKAFRNGRTHSGCPVAWADSALGRLQADLQKVLDAHEKAKGGDTELATDARYFLWQIQNLRAGFDNQSRRRMSDAAREAWRRNPETLREARALLAKIGT